MERVQRWTKSTLADQCFYILNYSVLLLVMVVTLFPFLHVLAISLNDSTDTVRGGITIWPREFTLDNYLAVFNHSTLLTGFVNSVLRTVIGTVLGLISGTMLAYTLSRRDFQGRRFVSLFLVLTLYFSGGMIPVYMLIRDLGLMNSFWVYVLPGMVNAFYVFMIRSFIDALPYELQESAKLDGANDFVIYWRVILPLCKPVIATIALFLAVGQWNAWFDTYLYNGSSPHLTTLQYELMKILQSAQTGNEAAMRSADPELAGRVSPDSLKMAITMVTVIPILFVYPFVQRYFIKGMTLGSVKH
ncbi:carbohydrate ABC transporter permease [Desmospora activa]|uniref:Carbohydrate ABC transporter membrane protein 2 (CUT1 family) n=1 Tax=Desmospora activa DSM 45169 TaxID=1121389 RepID=A0A2T4ZC87_9BACL|nr:carbohydrate ABC transporter permease [Desmospora activa]PTM59510.1 carbohydrate ABC transporter membrane protein 2 (CUT1 family) [Desmospora activa DSM 45169]